ncbi:MAG: hypothetical protein Q9180_001956 [Flavoplaca navasiana]
MTCPVGPEAAIPPIDAYAKILIIFTCYLLNVIFHPILQRVARRISEHQVSRRPATSSTSPSLTRNGRGLFLLVQLEADTRHWQSSHYPACFSEPSLTGLPMHELEQWKIYDAPLIDTAD